MSDDIADVTSPIDILASLERQRQDVRDKRGVAHRASDRIAEEYWCGKIDALNGVITTLTDYWTTIGVLDERA